MVTTKMNWSGPNVIHFGRKSQFGPDQFILVVTISFWSRPNHYGQVQINLVRPKPFWTDQKYFGHIKGQGIRTYCPNIYILCLGLAIPARWLELAWSCALQWLWVVAPRTHEWSKSFRVPRGIGIGERPRRKAFPRCHQSCHPAQ